MTNYTKIKTMYIEEFAEFFYFLKNCCGNYCSDCPFYVKEIDKCVVEDEGAALKWLKKSYDGWWEKV